MSRDLHLIEGEGEDLLFFPETYRLYTLPKEQGLAVTKALAGEGPIPEPIGRLLAEGRETVKPERKAQAPETTTLCLYMAHDCNLSCSYCYNQGGRSVNPAMMMPEAVAETTFRRFFTRPGGIYSVGFYGGEPLLNFPVIKRAVEIGEALKKERGIEITYGITTNGTILDEEMTGFMAAHSFSVTVSLDGPGEVNDLHRRYKGAEGGSVYERALENIRRLKDAGVRVTIKGTLAGGAVHSFESSLAHLEGLGVEVAILTPVNVRPGNQAFISDEKYMDFVERYAGLIRRDFMDIEERKGRWTEQTFTIIANLLTKRRLLRHCNAGHDVAVTADGSVYACHGLVGTEKFRMGSVFDEESDAFNQVREAFSCLNVDDLEECRDCWARYLCGGSCYAHAYENRGSISLPDPRHCALFTKAAETVIAEFMRLMADPSGRERLYKKMREAIASPKAAVHG
ncbi:MAG: radical SAM protein [Thermodesulfovibrionales bacterium]|jgi:uncharacterized protein